MLHSGEVGKVRLLQVGQMYQTSDTSPETEEAINTSKTCLVYNSLIIHTTPKKTGRQNR